MMKKNSIKMNNKIIAIGPTTCNNKIVNGQSMMFQLLVDELRRKNIKTTVIDFSNNIFGNNENRVSGKFSWNKSINYIIIIIRFFFIALLNRNAIVYLTTAQSKVGFIRDYFIIQIAKLFRNKIVTHQFGANFANFYTGLPDRFKRLIKNTYRKIDTIIVEGEFTKNQFNFLSDYETKVHPIANGLPEKVNNGAITAKTMDEEPIQVFYLSNMIESKGYWDVLLAINLLIKVYKLNVKVVFAGKFLESVDDKKFSSAHEARTAFFDFIKNNHIEANVSYREGLYGADKSVAFKKAHFFILPSYYINEGQPVSVLEALAYGCVPIVTKYRLIPTMVNDKNGFFVPSNAPDEIARIINELFKNPMQYTQRSRSGIDFYLQNFTPEKYTEKILSLLI